MARKSKDPDKAKSKSGKPKRRQQLVDAYRQTKENDPRIGLILLAVFFGAFAVLFGLSFLVFHWAFSLAIALPLAFMAMMIVFGRRATKAAYRQIEGRPGAGAAALSQLKRGWEVKPAVAATKNQEIVHRVVGRSGIVLVAEGEPSRVRNLLLAERKKHARVVPDDIPIHEVVVGDGEDQVPVPKLAKYVMKLPKAVAPGEVTDLLQRLKALDRSRPQVPMPKGPMPQSSKSARQMMRGR